jgi:hypothetical protein
MAEHVPAVKTALKYFDLLLNSFHSSEYTGCLRSGKTHRGHLNPRRRCDGKHSLEVKNNDE